MILNELLTRQNVITKIELKDGDKELSKELKVKVMRIRLAYNKVKKAFDEDVKEFVEQITTDEYKESAKEFLKKWELLNKQLPIINFNFYWIT